MGPGAGLETEARELNSSRPARSLVTILSELPWLRFLVPNITISEAINTCQSHVQSSVQEIRPEAHHQDGTFILILGYSEPVYHV
jgi:hypothetical protein